MQTNRLFRFFLFVCALLSLACWPARAATTTINFDTDPRGTGLFIDVGSGDWRPTGGNPATGGYLKITDAVGSERSVLLFEDLDNGAIISAFSFSMDVRIGNGTASPADGFSINYARNNDPIVLGNGTGNFASSPAGEANLPEEGTQTGLAIGFDAWLSGGTTGGDVIGITVRIDNVIVTNIAMGTLNGSCTDTTSLQTGPRDTANPGSPDGLCWAPVRVNLDDDGTLDISYKTRIVLTNFQTAFFPSPGRLIFAGRTGGSYQNQHVDNISITTVPATSPAITGVIPTATGFNLTILDQAGASPLTNTLVLQVDGAVVPITSLARQGDTTFLGYSIFPNRYTSGSSHAISLAFTDSNGASVARNATVTIPTTTSIPTEYALPVSNLDLTKAGFKARVHQLPVGRGPDNVNTIAKAERHQAGGFIDPSTGLPYDNIADLTAATDGVFVDENVINWNQDAPSAIGNFSANSTPPMEDEPVPGIPGTTLSTDSYVAEIQTYLELKGGVYRFGVNSDDGFKVSVARSPGDVNGLVLGSFNGGRPAGDSIFDFIAPVDGAYPFRLLWWEGGGGSSVEFFMVDLLTNQKILINDLSAAVPIRAYREISATYPAVTKVLPASGSNLNVPTADVVVEITDGTVPVDVESVNLTVNGTAVGGATKTGSVAVIKRTGSLASLLPGGANNAALVYAITSGGQRVLITNTWSFTVGGTPGASIANYTTGGQEGAGGSVPTGQGNSMPIPYAIIPAANKVPASSIDLNQPGFKVLRVHQIDRSLDASQGNGGRYSGQNGSGNRMPRPEIQLSNGYINRTNNTPYPNLADLSLFNPVDGTLNIDGVVNFNQTAANAGAWNPEEQMPGMPGGGTSTAGAEVGTDNFSMEMVTYLQLKAGSYLMSVNSDDGYVLTSAPNPRDTLGTLVGYFNDGGGSANPPARYLCFVVLEDGIYPFRLLYWEGGGGANLEWMTVDLGSGQTALINDTGGSPLAISAFREYTGPARPWVKFSVYPLPSRWENTHQQTGPGPILVKVGGTNPSDWANGAPGSSGLTNRPFADGVGAIIADLGTGTVTMRLDGAAVTPTLTQSGSDTIVSYKPATPLSSASAHTASLIYAGVTNSWTFNVQTAPVVPASVAIPPARFIPTAEGIRARVTKIRNGTANIATSVARAEDHLRGALKDASGNVITNTAVPNPDRADGAYIVPTVNWNQEKRVPPGNNSENGYFRQVTGFTDQPIPGVGLGTTGEANTANDLIQAEILAYLDLPAGYHKMGVNSDDGFRVTAAEGYQASPLVLGVCDGGKGSSDVPFSFVTPVAGLYPIRLVWFEGGGGANIEFFSYGANGEKILVNDRANTNAIKAYYDVIPIPAVAITGPANGTIHAIFPTNITITADASIVNDSIVKVEFFSGATKIGEATGAPYSIVLSNVPEGRYTLTAKATAANGFTTVSAPVKIVVGIPVISNVVETGGDNEATDTVTAKWTGVTFVNGIANEPIPNTPASDPYTVELFGQESPAFVDRNHQWEGASAALPLPAYLVGAEYIMSGNDNRDNTAYKLDITVSVEALAYLLIDNRLGDGNNADPANHPNWLGDRSGGAGNVADGKPDMGWVVQDGWQPSANGLNRAGNAAWPDEVGVDEGADGSINQWSSVYVKRIPAGTFTINQPDNHGQNMYGVVVRRAPAAALVFAAPVLNSDGTVTIAWTGTGTLEETSSLAAPITWTPAASQANPQTVAVTGTKFYRLRQ